LIESLLTYGNHRTSQYEIQGQTKVFPPVHSEHQFSFPRFIRSTPKQKQ